MKRNSASKSNHPPRTPNPAWTASLWLAQVVLAAAFGMAGVMKATTPISELAAMLPWTADAPELLVRFIGLAEVAGAIGLILPSLTRIQPRLTPLAAAGLVVVMVLGAGFHISLGEFEALPINVGLAALAGFVVWGRTKKAPIQAGTPTATAETIPAGVAR